MKIKGINFKIDKNPNNKFWNPIGMFNNIPKVLIDNVWFKCGISFELRGDKRYMRFTDPMIVNEKSNVIENHYIKGLYNEVEVSSLYMNYILYRLNQHKLNYKIFNLKHDWIKWRGRRVVFSIVILLTMSLFLINRYMDSGFLKTLSDNIYVQMIGWFFTFLGVFALFTPKNTTLKE